MGAWSTSITGNDTALDLKSEYQAAFYYYDVETALRKIDEYVRNFPLNESDEEEWCGYYYSLADFMWRRGILTEEVKKTALEMIDSGFGLEIWEESGASVLNKRKKELDRFKEKLLSEQPPRKKIRIDLHTTPVFEKGDIIALQLKTADKHYLPEDSLFSEELFRACDGKWIVLRKLWDDVSYTSRIVPEVKNIWPMFQLYGKIFDECPCAEQLNGLPFAKCKYGKHGIFGTEGSMFYFKKRNAVVIGKNTDQLDEICDRKYYNLNDDFYFGINKSFYNADTEIINSIVRDGSSAAKGKT